jgi:hypothetical protein
MRSMESSSKVRGADGFLEQVVDALEALHERAVGVELRPAPLGDRFPRREPASPAVAPPLLAFGIRQRPIFEKARAGHNESTP